MVWTYNPLSNIHETYNVDEHSDLHVSRKEYKWEDIPFPYNADENGADVDLPRLISSNGLLTIQEQVWPNIKNSLKENLTVSFKAFNMC